MENNEELTQNALREHIRDVWFCSRHLLETYTQDIIEKFTITLAALINCNSWGMFTREICMKCLLGDIHARLSCEFKVYGKEYSLECSYRFMEDICGRYIFMKSLMETFTGDIVLWKNPMGDIHGSKELMENIHDKSQHSKETFLAHSQETFIRHPKELPMLYCTGETSLN